MHFLLITRIFLTIPLIYGHSDSKTTSSESNTAPTNDLGLTFGHTVSKRDNVVVIYFDLFNSTLKDYRYYYFNFRSFGSFSGNEYLPRQRLHHIHNSLRIIGLHEDDYVTCLSFIDEYETIFNPRYACYEFTLGEKVVGSHHETKSGYLVPALVVVAVVLHVLIAIIHYIKSKNYAHKLLHRFIDVTSKSSRRKIVLDVSLKELDKELDQPHIPAYAQRRLSRVAIDVSNENESNHLENHLFGDPNDELPLYTLPHHSRRVSLATMEAIPEDRNTDAIDSALSVRHLLDSTPWMRRANRTNSLSMRKTNQLHF
ncbi:unnamed protein product [Rotaria socialis]|uniref:Uncharacterized protein n=1 Tax=Rotaria socialis TaxID=392032 RepID=A0A821KEW7_9BILA|nr:unnamed protein product [Rotaria socialis]CAF3729538.1 unnamed protein product [Rotaria socialis]CAF4528053.1 unnamed protein product [Rotaria socialis]CAF4733629.1 unnamed protein product [Rotaria socialis]